MLSRFISRNRGHKQKNHYENEFGTFLLSQEKFTSRLRHERLRSERSGLPVSLVIIDCDGLLDICGQSRNLSHNGVICHLGDTLKKYTRESDIKGYYQNGKVALIAPYTDDLGAQTLAANLKSHMLQCPGLDGELEESELSRCIHISSLNDDRSYLNSKNADNKTSRFIETEQLYCVESPPSHFGELNARVAYGSAEVAVLEWPFYSEITNHLQLYKFQLKVKRIIDVVGSLFGILLFGPLMLVIAALVRITSPGPAIFRQERLGFLSKPFTFLKFRSMKVDADPSLHKEYVTSLIEGKSESTNLGTNGGPIYKLTRDPRITPFGHILRKTSLDELPQFFNVLKGDMSLVGPRPPICYECEKYERWHCRRVLEVKPGITGLWQISGRSSTTFEEMVRLDLSYVRNWSPWLDLKIILKTFWAVVSMRGGY